jgi:hypothetical protein
VRTYRLNLDDLYVPTEKQVLLHQSTADECLYGGAAGGGKSHALVMDAFTTALQFPGTSAYLFRRTYPELEETLIKIARQIIPKELGTYSTNRHEFELVNGSMLKFRHCNTVADVYAYQGAEIQFLYIDELTHFPKAVYDYLKTRVRARKSLGVKPFIRCASNPGGIGHSWVKERFVDPHPEGGTHVEEITSELTGETERRVIQYIPATVLDNPHISRGYVFELESKPKNLRDALLLGKWDAFEGQVFVEWMNDPNKKQEPGTDIRRPIGTHVVHPFEIPDWWPRWMSYDHGYEKPFSCGWWAVDPEHDTVYRYAEWYGCSGTPNVGIKLDIDLIAKGIRERETAMHPGMSITRVADPHLWDEDGGDSIQRMFAKHGIHFRQGDNNRLAGKLQLHYRLRPREDGCPRLYVFSTCRDFIRTIPALSYNPLAEGAKAEDIDTKQEDHVYDETRYFLMEFRQAAYTPPKEPVVFKPGRLNPFASTKSTASRAYVPR